MLHIKTRSSGSPDPLVDNVRVSDPATIKPIYGEANPTDELRQLRKQANLSY